MSHPVLATALLLGAALVFSGASYAAGPGPMQVEEPAAQAAQPPIQPEKDGEGWKSRKNATLSASQQAALKARQDTMKDMMALIQKKRRAIREARPQDRQALAQELHQLILDQAQGADRNVSRAEERKDMRAGEADPAAKARAERALEQQEEFLSQQEARRQQAEEKLKQVEAKTAAEEKKTGE